MPENRQFSRISLIQRLAKSRLKKTFSVFYDIKLLDDSGSKPWLHYGTKRFSTQEVIYLCYVLDPTELENVQLVEEEEKDRSFFEITKSVARELFQRNKVVELDTWLQNFIKSQPTVADIIFLFCVFEQELEVFFSAPLQKKFALIVDANQMPRPPLIRDSETKLYFFVKGLKMIPMKEKGNSFLADAALYLIHCGKIEKNPEMLAEFRAIEVTDQHKGVKQTGDYDAVNEILKTLEKNDCAEKLGISMPIQYKLDRDSNDFNNTELFMSLLGGWNDDSENKYKHEDSVSQRMIARIKKYSAERSVSNS